MMTWVFDWEITDRARWPSLSGRVAVGDCDTREEAFQLAHEIVAVSTRAPMVTRLDCVSWPLDERGL